MYSIQVSTDRSCSENCGKSLIYWILWDRTLLLRGLECSTSLCTECSAADLSWKEYIQADTPVLCTLRQTSNTLNALTYTEFYFTCIKYDETKISLTDSSAANLTYTEWRGRPLLYWIFSDRELSCPESRDSAHTCNEYPDGGLTCIEYTEAGLSCIETWSKSLNKPQIILSCIACFKKGFSSIAYSTGQVSLPLNTVRLIFPLLNVLIQDSPVLNILRQISH